MLHRVRDGGDGHVHDDVLPHDDDHSCTLHRVHDDGDVRAHVHVYVHVLLHAILPPPNHAYALVHETMLSHPMHPKA